MRSRPPQSFTVKSADGRWDLFGLMYTPISMDPAKKYPVIVGIYPGPQGGSVGFWGFSAGRGDNQALAELGFVVVQIEGSCNPGRSKSFHDACYGNMGENTLSDQVSGLRQLAERFGYLDLDRVGIWGHSGGGYAAADAMFRLYGGITGRNASSVSGAATSAPARRAASAWALANVRPTTTLGRPPSSPIIVSPQKS